MTRATDEIVALIEDCPAGDPAFNVAGPLFPPGTKLRVQEPWWAFVTERRVPGDGRMERTVIRLRDEVDCAILQRALRTGALKPRTGVHAYAQRWR